MEIDSNPCGSNNLASAVEKRLELLLPRPQKMPQVGDNLPRSSYSCGGGVFLSSPREPAPSTIPTSSRP